MLGLLKELEVMLAALPRKPAFQKWQGDFSVTAESEKPPLKKLWHAAIKQQEAMLNSEFLYLEFLFKPSWILNGF